MTKQTFIEVWIFFLQELSLTNDQKIECRSQIHNTLL